MENERVRRAFERWWPDLEARLKAISPPSVVSNGDSGIRITSPRDGQSIYGEFAIEGSFKSQPEKEVRVFVASTRAKRIWPQDSVNFDVRNKTWSTTVNLWEQPKPDAYLFVAGLGKDATILCHYYGVVADITKQWIPLRELTSDAVEYDRVRVINGFRKDA